MVFTQAVDLPVSGAPPRTEILALPFERREKNLRTIQIAGGRRPLIVVRLGPPTAAQRLDKSMLSH